MIRMCLFCRHYYWRYKRDWETPGFCSSLCHDLRQGERRAGRDQDPGIPAAIQALIRSHLLIVHHTSDPDELYNLGLFCEECERLEAKYAESIAWHLPNVEFTRQSAGAAL